MVNQEKLDLARMKPFKGCQFFIGMRNGKLWMNEDDKPQ
jgi:hypothetical protein